METLSTVVRESFPNYLRSLPVPSSVKGIFQLSLSEWFRLTPLVAALTVPSYLVYKKYILPQSSSDNNNGGGGRSKVNLNVKKDSPKVVDVCDIEDVVGGGQKVYCRCWRSKNFPLCDGSHNSHNEVTGDNVGPLIVKQQQPQRA